MSQKNINPLVPEMRRTILNLAVSNFKARESFILNEILLGHKPDAIILESIRDSYSLVLYAAAETFMYKEQPELNAMTEEAEKKALDAGFARAEDFMRRNKIILRESVSDVVGNGGTGYPDVSDAMLETSLQTSVLLYKTITRYRTVMQAEGLCGTTQCKLSETLITEGLSDIQNMAFIDAITSLEYHGKTNAKAEDACELLELMGMTLTT